MKKSGKYISIFMASGILYCFLEILYRRYTHWSMGIIGGTCFLALFKVYENIKMVTLIEKCVIGAFVITFIEFISGCIVNLWLKMNIWDYSNLPLNLCGQVCLLYSILWGILCIPISYFSPKIKNKIFD